MSTETRPDTPEKREALLDRPLLKILEVRTKAITPSEEQLAMIRPFLLREFEPEELYIREVLLANDQVDRSFERFDMGYLKRFAETIKGKSVLVGHDYGAAPVGRFFNADITRGERDWQWVRTWFYMPTSPGNQLARDNIDSGVWSYVSIGAAVDYAGLICDICGQPYYYWYGDDEDAYCPHIAGRAYNDKVCTLTWDSNRSDTSKVEAVEGSIVYLGCQYDAAIAKSAAQSEANTRAKAARLESHNTPPDGRQKEAVVMSDTAAMESLQAELAAKAKECDALTGKVGEFEARIKELEGRISELEPLEARAKEADRLREDLVTEIKRLAACVGVGEVIVSTIDKVEDIEKLLELRGEYQRKWSEMRPPAPQSDGEGNPAEPAGETRSANPALSSSLPGYVI